MNPNNPNNEKTAPKEKATKPGVVSASSASSSTTALTPQQQQAEQAVARLDQRIAEKQQQYQKPAAANSAFDAVPRTTTPAPPATMQAFEEFVLGSGTNSTSNDDGDLVVGGIVDIEDDPDMRAKEDAIDGGMRGGTAITTGTPVMDGSAKFDDSGIQTKEDLVLAESAPDGHGMGGSGGGHNGSSAPNTTTNDVEYGVYEPNEDGLAVAMPVMEDEEDVFIPSAVEYDPDAKPPLHRNRRFRLYAFLAFFALVAGAVGATIGIVLNNNNSDNDDGDIHPREKLQIRETIERVVGEQNVQDLSSPYAQAVTWIIYDDPMELTPLDDNFVQRYIMAYFYFATSVNGDWFSCAPLNSTAVAATMTTSEAEAMLEEDNLCVFQQLRSSSPLTYNEIEGQGRWLSALHECEWAGLSCGESQEIRLLDLPGQEMSGAFPEGIMHLPFLQAFSIELNGLTGTIPSEISQLKHLVNFEVQSNQMTGEIPEELYDLRNLVRLNLGENQFEGTISTRIGNIRDLKGLFLYRNRFSGNLPTELGTLLTLTYLRLNQNKFAGVIPSEIGNLKGVKTVLLGNNDFTGGLPEEISQMSALETFTIPRLPRLGGHFPDAFWNLTEMSFVDIRGCNMTGSIGEGVANMRNLVSLRLSNNRFTGVVPVGLTNSDIFQELWIGGNNITGPPPLELCEKQGTLFLRSFFADCKGEDPEFECPCCTGCCNADGAECVFL